MLCKIWGVHGGDYEECRLMGYKNQVHTSQETHYVSATDRGRLIFCNIWGFHSGVVFWDLTPCGSCKTRRFGGSYSLVTADAVPSSPILFTLIMEAIRSSETSVLIRTTRRKIPGDDVLRTKLFREELRDFYTSSSIIRMIVSRRMRLAGHVARMEYQECVYDFWTNGNSEEWRLQGCYAV
jgi:hypothetical protein